MGMGSTPSMGGRSPFRTDPLLRLQGGQSDGFRFFVRRMEAVHRLRWGLWRPSVRWHRGVHAA
jgi:hypothetical protein